MAAQENNPHIGSDFDDFLQEEGLYAEVNAGAAKKLLALQLSQALQENSITKTELASKDADKSGRHQSSA